MDFLHQKEIYFEEWKTAKKVDNEYEKLKQSIMFEEFNNCIDKEVNFYIDERKY